MLFWLLKSKIQEIFMSQRSVSNASESKCPICTLLTIVGVQWIVGVHLSCACGCHVGVER